MYTRFLKEVSGTGDDIKLMAIYPVTRYYNYLNISIVLKFPPKKKKKITSNHHEERILNCILIYSTCVSN